MGQENSENCDNNDENDNNNGSDSSMTQFQDGQLHDLCELPLSSICNCLIEHFDILFSQNKIGWPRQRRQAIATVIT